LKLDRNCYSCISCFFYKDVWLSTSNCLFFGGEANDLLSATCSAVSLLSVGGASGKFGAGRSNGIINPLESFFAPKPVE